MLPTTRFPSLASIHVRDCLIFDCSLQPFNARKEGHARLLLPSTFTAAPSDSLLVLFNPPHVPISPLWFFSSPSSSSTSSLSAFCPLSFQSSHTSKPSTLLLVWLRSLRLRSAALRITYVLYVFFLHLDQPTLPIVQDAGLHRGHVGLGVSFPPRVDVQDLQRRPADVSLKSWRLRPANLSRGGHHDGLRHG
ncbi:hypothetical protein LX36DRAFT_368398 [Colletotrichum falcatum]|nr:hypothetical protein LX36DRAFT_368398 [Colletotrichum falcatum]